MKTEARGVMNVKRGLHRIAIAIIFCIAAFFCGGSIVNDFDLYYKRVDHLMNAIQYIFVPEEDSITGWSFNKFKYEEAINAGYSTEEVVNFLSEQYSDFNLEVFQSEVKKIEIKNLITSIIKSIFTALVYSITLYVLLFLIYLMAKWVCNGFKQKVKKN